MTTFRIAVLPGDGIGQEVTPQAVRVLETVGKGAGVQFDFEQALIGGSAIDATGTPLPPQTLALCLIPVEDLLALPEVGLARAGDVLDHPSEMLEAVWGAHDVGVQNDGHYAGGALRIVSELLELVDGALGILGCLVMLDQHHGDVIAFLRVGHADDGRA